MPSPPVAEPSGSSSFSSTPEHLKDNHITPRHPSSTSRLPISTHLPTFLEDLFSSKALTTSSVKTPTSLVRPLSSSAQWISEVACILRPLVYGAISSLAFAHVNLLTCSVVILLSSKRKGNRALNSALAFECLALILRRVPASSSALERSEYARRDRDIVWYLLRGWLWEDPIRYVCRFLIQRRFYLTSVSHPSRQSLQDLVDKTAHIPFLQAFSAFLKGRIPLIDEHYYCTCGSSSFRLRWNHNMLTITFRHCSITLGHRGPGWVGVRLCVSVHMRFCLGSRHPPRIQGD